MGYVSAAFIFGISTSTPGENKFELTDRLRAANEGAWKRRENFGEEDAVKFKELTGAEPVD